MQYSDLTSELLSKSRIMFSEIKKRQIGSVIHGEMFILKYIAIKKEPVLPSELSVVSKTSSARVAMALRNLESKGFIERRVDEKDRSKVLVTITESGTKEVEKIHEKIHAVMERLISELGEEDVREYIRIVDRVIEINRRMSIDE